ncbi:hypothetical protein M0R04_14010 [Candidatus Dojkabacteria bacterium]|jgi:hypothetical protein|nr:hypothetical protein [Candidatus Dojkabacteria bacterium]
MKTCERCKKEFKPMPILDDFWQYENITGGTTEKWTCFECKAEVYHLTPQD